MVTTAFTVNNLIAFSIWALIGDKIAGYFRPPDSARKPNTMFGVVLAAVAVWMVLSYVALSAQQTLEVLRFIDPELGKLAVQ